MGDSNYNKHQVYSRQVFNRLSKEEQSKLTKMFQDGATHIELVDAMLIMLKKDSLDRLNQGVVDQVLRVIFPRTGGKAQRAFSHINPQRGYFYDESSPDDEKKGR